MEGRVDDEKGERVGDEKDELGGLCKISVLEFRRRDGTYDTVCSFLYEVWDLLGGTSFGIAYGYGVCEYRSMEIKIPPESSRTENTFLNTPYITQNIII